MHVIGVKNRDLAAALTTTSREESSQKDENGPLIPKRFAHLNLKLDVHKGISLAFSIGNSARFVKSFMKKAPAVLPGLFV